MLLPLIREQYISFAEAAIVTDENVWEAAFLDDKIDTHRVTAIKMLYGSKKYIQPQWVMKYIPTYKETLQTSDCYVRFYVPPFIILDEMTSGIQYIGTIDGMCHYRLNRTKGQLSAYTKNKYTKGRIQAYWQQGYLELYGEGIMVEQVRLDFIPERVKDIPTFNPNAHDYPVSTDLLSVMYELWKKDLALYKGLQPDLLSNTTPQVQQPKQQEQ
jgi:hypothetical protein